MLGHPYKREETPFGRLIVKRTPQQDGTEEIELECGHSSIQMIPPYPGCEELPCSQCVNEYIKQEKRTSKAKL